RGRMSSDGGRRGVCAGHRARVARLPGQPAYWVSCRTRLARVPDGGPLGGRAADPFDVAGLPGTAGALVLENRVDEADEVRVRAGDRQAVGLVGQVRAHDLRERVLGREGLQDRVVAADARHLALLQLDEAVGDVRGRDDLRVRALDAAYRV